MLTELESGKNIIKAFAQSLEKTPGVYRMLGEEGEVLYVGKAVKLRNRVLSYTHVHGLPLRLQRMVGLTKSMMFLYTESEAKALLLESDLIKTLKPRFNIMLRDDKTYPEIVLNAEHPYPSILKHRGKHQRFRKYFGPFSDILALNHVIKIMQKVFLIRNCKDTYFSVRKRPCLQYQIHRCSAPCVGYISQEDYDFQIQQVLHFFNGKNQQILSAMEQKMYQVAQLQHFEKAIAYRNQIKYLASIVQQQDSPIHMRKNCDIFAFVFQEDHCSIAVFFIRKGLHFGNNVMHESIPQGMGQADFIEQFLMHWYNNKEIPKIILLNKVISSMNLIQEALSIKATSSVSLSVPIRGDRKKLLDWALDHVHKAIKKIQKEKEEEKKLVDTLSTLLQKKNIRRIEAYDNSHLMGSYSTGAMIVYKPYRGFIKNEYRRYNIEDPKLKENDTAMMRYVLLKRLQHLKDDPSQERPDVLFIDGGAPQLREAIKVLDELNLPTICAIGIAKGLYRNKSQEKIYLHPDKDPLVFSEDDPVLFYMERIRDEVHRFVIQSHRKKRAKGLLTSALDAIPGIGNKRRKSLILYFGSVRSISIATLTELQSVPGISKSQAHIIYHWFRSS